MPTPTALPQVLPGEWLLSSSSEPCPYLPGRVARMPLRRPRRPLRPEEFDERLAGGDRRVGPMLYRTDCPDCRACEPLRIAVDRFQPSRSQQRVWRRNEDLRVEVGPAVGSPDRLHLFNRHKLERGLSRSGEPMSMEHYEGWFVRTCTTTVEMRFLLGERLLGLGILDLGARDSSSVYFFFDPDEGRRSLGTFSVLAEIAWLRQRGGRHHYLGLYVADCRHLLYKASFFPHERLVGGVWREVDRRAPDADRDEP